MKKGKKRWGIVLVLSLVLAATIQISVLAAGAAVTIHQCFIAGNTVNIVATTPAPQSPDGMYYLFELKPYEAGIGARMNYCATAPAASDVIFTTTLDYNTAASKLYSRFVIATFQNGMFVPVSNEMYVTNPEALATKATGYPVKSKKGLTADWRFSDELSDLGAGYAAYELDVSRFLAGGGVNYTYNGKTYSFNAGVVSEYDIICNKFASEGCNVVMVIKNSFNPATLDMIAPTGRVPGKNCYAFNVDEQIPLEKLEALMSFLANRYSESSKAIHSWIIGNEINSSSPWHYMGDVPAEVLADHYAKEFRVCYNAIKSQNAGARVFMAIDQRWNFEDGAPAQYAGKKILDMFAANINTTGNIDWGVSFHPHPVPLFNCTFWSLPADYARMKLIDHTDNSKFLSPLNTDVLTNHLMQPHMLAPTGAVRHTIISEMGFTSYNASIPTNEMIQAAAMVYAYKLSAANPFIEGIIFHRQVDHAAEIINDGMAVGIRTETGIKYSYNVFKHMDIGNTPEFTDFALPIIGVSNWQQLGLN